MAIIKLKTRENPYVQIDKTGINDPNLSWKATGLLTYLVGRPADWKIVLEHLAGVKTDGITACKSALRELRSFNYCHYFELRQKGKVIETFYIIYEVPTPYSTELHNNILADIEGLDNTYSLVYKKVEKEPKVENPLSVESTENSDFLPKVENPLADKPLADNHRLLIIDHTKERKTNNRNHDHDIDDELDFFENLFKELGVNFTKTNKESVLRMRKHLSLKDTELYLRETYSAIIENKDVKNVEALFSAKIKKGERQVNTKKNTITVTENTEIKAEREKINNKEIKKDVIQEQKKEDIIEKFNSLDTFERLKIEEEAIELLVKEEKVSENFLLQAKEKNPVIYKGMIKSYLERVIELNKGLFIKR